jgi:tetratricopeptide (TPR) repeat protein
LSYPAAKGLAEMWIKEAIRVPSRRDGDVCRHKALKSYRDAIMLRPSATSLMIEAANLALRRGDTMTAFEIYSRAIAVNPTNRSAIDGVIKTAELKGKVALAKLYKEYLAKVKTVR